MKENQLEPGLLRTFRMYAGLRIALLVISMGMQTLFFESRPRNNEPENQMFVMGIIFISMLLLGLYLYSDWAREKLRKFYLPVALLFAASSLILEQRWFSPGANIWQPDSFFFVLLIFVAWQYNFKIVLLFIVAFLGIEYFTSPLQPYGWGVRAKDLEDVNYFMINTGRLIARSLSSIVLGFIITQLVQAQREQRESLQEKNQLLLKNATSSEQLAISHERNRISRELHDTLAHSLSGMSVQLDAVLGTWKDIPANAKTLLEELLSTTRTGLKETRRALQNLRSSPLDELGLVLALKSMAEETGIRNALEVTMDIPEDIQGLTPHDEQGFYRIAQEALENIVRHANATNVQLSISESPAAIQMLIHDDGLGFILDTVSVEKLGLQGMRERAQLIGAGLSIDSTIGSGTSITLTKDLNS